MAVFRVERNKGYILLFPLRGYYYMKRHHLYKLLKTIQQRSVQALYFQKNLPYVISPHRTD